MQIPIRVAACTERYCDGDQFKQIYKVYDYANQYRTLSLKKRNRVNL